MFSIFRSGGVVVGFAVSFASATTTLTSHYDNHVSDPITGRGAEGYVATAGDYVIQPTATFDYNQGEGFFADRNTASSVTINGGDFSYDFAGLDVRGGALTVNGGNFTHNGNGYGIGAFGPTTIISGGVFQNNNWDMFLSGQTKIQGRFGSTGPTTFMLEVATLDLYGSFAGVAVGQTLTITSFTSTVVGTLDDSTPYHAFSFYDIYGSTLRLHSVFVAPEPCFLGAIGLIAMSLATRTP